MQEGAPAALRLHIIRVRGFLPAARLHAGCMIGSTACSGVAGRAVLRAPPGRPRHRARACTAKRAGYLAAGRVLLRPPAMPMPLPAALLLGASEPSLAVAARGCAPRAFPAGESAPPPAGGFVAWLFAIAARRRLSPAATLQGLAPCSGVRAALAVAASCPAAVS